MKSIAFLASVICGLSVGINAQAALITNFDDIQNWTGTGSNRAALVIQWNDGETPTSLAWGYRWDGQATGYDMLRAISGTSNIYDASNPSTPLFTSSGADDRLAAGIYDYGWGYAVQSIEFNTGSYLRTQNDWDNGYWEYFNVGGSFLTPPEGDENTFVGTDNYPGSDWISSWSGFDTRELADGSWDAWSFAANFISVPVVQPYDANTSSSAVPEPGQIASSILLIAGISVYIWRRRRLSLQKE